MATPKAREKPAAANSTTNKKTAKAPATGASVISKETATQTVANVKAMTATGPRDKPNIPSHQPMTIGGALPIHRFDPEERIAVIRNGIPASMITSLSSRMGMSKETLLLSLGLSRATISRKEKNSTVLSKDESERVLGIETLIGMVQTMVEQSGDPLGFDAARWVSDWLTKPLPALAGATPASYMDTFEGQKLVAGLLSMSQSGAYA